MKKILILGADGMVGHIARIYLSERGHDIISVARNASVDWDSLNVEDEAALVSYISRKKPEIILNCVGVLIKESEVDPVRAIRLNSLLPRVLASNAEKEGFALIHVSSDCVFSGSGGPYSENDIPDSNEVYGRTKALGEIINKNDLTIRTSKVGPELRPDGSGLFNWFMNQKGTIRGFGKALWGGVTTLEMAKFVDYYINNPVNGLFHLTNGQKISKYDLLCLFSEIWGKRDIEIQRDDSKESDRSLITSRGDINYSVPPYRKMLEELYDFMLAHKKNYDLYHL
jgi:dTDP-4-dehydrorhamnose reductase